MPLIAYLMVSTTCDARRDTSYQLCWGYFLAFLLFNTTGRDSSGMYRRIGLNHTSFICLSWNSTNRAAPYWPWVSQRFWIAVAGTPQQSLSCETFSNLSKQAFLPLDHLSRCQMCPTSKRLAAHHNGEHPGEIAKLLSRREFVYIQVLRHAVPFKVEGSLSFC